MNKAKDLEWSNLKCEPFQEIATFWKTWSLSLLCFLSSILLPFIFLLELLFSLLSYVYPSHSMFIHKYIDMYWDAWNSFRWNIQRSGPSSEGLGLRGMHPTGSKVQHLLGAFNPLEPSDWGNLIAPWIAWGALVGTSFRGHVHPRD